jgi:anti-anti-sigma factor
VPSSTRHRARPATGDLLRVTARPGDARGRVVVEVTGTVDEQTVPLLEACLRTQTRRPGLRELVVDTTGGAFLDEAGLAALVRTRARCRARGARLVVSGDAVPDRGQSSPSGAPHPAQRGCGGPSSSRPHAGQTRLAQHAGSPPSS